MAMQSMNTVDTASLIDQAVKNAVTYGEPGTIVHRWIRSERLATAAPYLTTFPRYKRHGECKVGLPEARVTKTFTCEIRWPGGLSAGTETFTLGIDDERFVFAGKLVRMVSELTKRAVAAIAPHSTVEFSDTWKPHVAGARGITMQRLFTIEVRVDFRDESKLELFKQIIQQAGRHVYGQSALLGDGVKPEIIMHGHDFFLGHQDIALFEDTVLTGQTAIQAAVDRPAAPTTTSAAAGGDMEGFSNELMAALKA